MKNRYSSFLFVAVFYISYAGNAAASDVFADSHIHFNWNQDETSAEQAVKILKQANVGLTIVSSTPTYMALELKEAGGDWIIPFFSPYTHVLGRRDWFRDKEVVKKAEQGLKSGLYFGIGEVHFMAGFPPKTNNPVFVGLLTLAKIYDVPVMVHIDSANELTFLNLCVKYPDIKLIFAHAGGNLKPEHIRKILSQCHKVWVDFAARDPWRYGGISNADFTLLPEWKQLVLEFPERFITGTDPVWSVTRGQSWDLPDEGWSYYEKLLNFHWTWLNDLPEDVRRKISWENTNSLLNR
jgi:hypothetical protein